MQSEGQALGNGVLVLLKHLLLQVQSSMVEPAVDRRLDPIIQATAYCLRSLMSIRLDPDGASIMVARRAATYAATYATLTHVRKVLIANGLAFTQCILVHGADHGVPPQQWQLRSQQTFPDQILEKHP